jgi:hypothetical protein
MGGLRGDGRGTGGRGGGCRDGRGCSFGAVGLGVWLPGVKCTDGPQVPDIIAQFDDLCTAKPHCKLMTV